MANKAKKTKRNGYEPCACGCGEMVRDGRRLLREQDRDAAEALGWAETSVAPMRVWVPLAEGHDPAVEGYVYPEPPKTVLVADALYFGDNGRIFCGRHAGASALYTGRDLSGQAVERITDEMRAALESACKTTVECETCRAIRESKK